MTLLKNDDATVESPVWSNLTWPSWSWFDELFRDSEARRPFKIEECTLDGALLVRAELPGVDPDKDIEVKVVNDELVIQAHKTESHQHKGRHEYRSEFRYGTLTRMIPVPKGVDGAGITASYKDGVLEVRVPLPETTSLESAHRVPIQRA